MMWMNDDTMWMNEVALMQESYNGSDPNHGTYDGTEEQVKEKTQTWINNHPQHYAPPQGSMYQQIPPYHGYLLHGSCYPRNVVWPGNFQDSTAVFYDRDSKERKRYEDSKKKHKYAPKNRSQNETDDESVSSDELSRKNKKRSKRKVVVRNVNYYNVDADLSDEDDDGYICSDLIKQKVDGDNGNVDEGTREGEKKDLNWNIFENLLMKSSLETRNRDTGSNGVRDREECYSSAKPVNDGCGPEETKDRSAVLEDRNGVVRKNIEYYEELLIPPRMEEAIIGSESLVAAKYQKEDDWLINDYKPEISEEIDRAVLCIDQDNISGSSQRKGGFDQPDDLYMMIRRDSAASEQVIRSWNPEMDCVNDKSPLETVQIQNKTEDKTSNKIPGTKRASKIDPKTKSKSDVVPLRSKVSSTVSRKIKSEVDKEEEKMKKLEELKIQRQKRIAERTAAKAATTSENSKKPHQKMIKKNDVTKKTGISKTLESPSDNIKKPVMSNSTINRLSTARTSSSTKSRALVQNEKPASKRSNVPKTSSSRTVKGSKLVQEKVNTTARKRTATTSVSNKSKARSDEATTVLKNNGSEDFEDVKVLYTVISVEMTARKESYSTKTPQSKDASPDDHDEINPIIKHPSPDDHAKTIVEEQPSKREVEDRVVTFDPVIKCNDVKLTSATRHSGKNGDNQKKKLTFSPEISVVHIISTPPEDNPVIESNEEMGRSRKKWSDNSDGSAKAPKGFRKLLFFGRRI